MMRSSALTLCLLSALLPSPLALSAEDIPGIGPQTPVRVFQVKHLDVRYLLIVMTEVCGPKHITAITSERSKPRNRAEPSHLEIATSRPRWSIVERRGPTGRSSWRASSGAS